MRDAIRAKTILRYAYGLSFLAIGFDKFLGTDYIAVWKQYVSSVAAQIIPVEPFLLAVGLVEIVLGVALFTRWARPAAYLVALWLVGISGNLVLLQSYDIALRDLMLAAGAIALAWLSKVRREG